MFIKAFIKRREYLVQTTTSASNPDSNAPNL